MRSRARTLGIVLICLLLFTGPALAVEINGTVTIDAPDGPEVAITADGGDLELDGPDGPNTVDVVHDDGSATFSSTSSTAVDIETVDLEGSYSYASGIDTTNADLVINASDKSQITVGGGIDAIEWRNAVADDGSYDFNYSASSSATVDIKTDRANQSLLAVDSTGTVLDQSTSDSTGRVSFDSLNSGDYEVEVQTTSSPTLSNPDPDAEQLTTRQANLSIDVSDPDFGDSTDDEVTVKFYNGEDDSQYGTETLSSNGTAKISIDAEPGQNSWYATAEDNYGEITTSNEFTFETPASLQIFYETDPDELVQTDVPVRVRFFVDGEETVVEKSTTDGQLALDELPKDQRFIVTVRADDSDKLTYRRIIVDSLTETNQVFLLNKSQPNSQLLFDLQDPTGQFPPERTFLYIEKPITKDFDGDGTNETRYQTMAGDSFGASGEFPAVLQQDSRYRLRVESDTTSSSRILGAYSVAGPDTVPLQIQRIKPQSDVDSGSIVYGSVQGNEPNRQVAVRYTNPSDQDSTVTYRVINSSGGVFVENTTRTGEFADFYNIPNSSGQDVSYTVEYEVTRGGETISNDFTVGSIAEIADRFGVDRGLLAVISYVLILAVIGLVTLVNASLAPMAGVGSAALLTTIGTVTIPAPFLGIAGAIAVLTTFGRQ